MSVHLFGHRLCLHLKRVWDGHDYRLTFVVRTLVRDIRLRILPPGIRSKRLR